MLIFCFQFVNSWFTICNCYKKFWVSLLLCQELMDKLLNISHSSESLDLFEGFINAGRSLHFSSHFLSHECVPKFMKHELLSHLSLVCIFVFVLSRICNLLEMLFSQFSLSNRGLFILNWLVHILNSLWSIFLLRFDCGHESRQSILCLKELFKSLSVFLFFFGKD